MRLERIGIGEYETNELQVAQLWQTKPRDESAILRGRVTLRLNFRLKGYLWTVRYENNHTTTLPLEVFTARNFVADGFIFKIEFKNNKILFELTFGGLGGVDARKLE